MDDDGRELMERRLAERVESRVRGRLFAFYAAIGSVAVVLLGFVGYDVWSDLDAVVEGLEAKTSQYAQDAVADSVSEAEEAATAAGEQARAVAASLRALDDFQRIRTEQLLEAENEARKAEARVRQIQAENVERLSETEERLGRIADRIGETERQFTELIASIEAETEKQLSALRARTEEAAGIGNVAELAANLADLSEQVALLDEQLREIRARTAGERGYETPLADAGRIETIQAAAVQQAQVGGFGGGDGGSGGGVSAGVIGGGGDPFAGGPDTGANTVYVQFAGVPREVAESISARLEPLGFDVPGEERIGAAAGRHEVRYFFQEDRDRARDLADATNDILREQGYRAEVTPEPFTDFAGKKPRRGTLELWLEPEPAG